MLARPNEGEYNPYFAGYIAAVPDGEFIDILKRQTVERLALIEGIREEQGGHRYEECKWSIKEMLGHLNDTERVMSYRLLRSARGDSTNLPGFDQDAYIAPGEFGERSLAHLNAEFKSIRASSLALIESVPTKAWLHQGQSNGHPMSARAFAYVIAGHELHHLNVLKERYL